MSGIEAREAGLGAGPAAEGERPQNLEPAGQLQAADEPRDQALHTGDILRLILGRLSLQARSGPAGAPSCTLLRH